MAQKPKQAPKAPMPSAGPPVATQARAESLEDVGANWIIMPYEQYRVFRDMKADGAFTTTQRRDPAGTVLLAKLKVD